jgi:hypothetical protein
MVRTGVGCFLSFDMVRTGVGCLLSFDMVRTGVGHLLSFEGWSELTATNAPVEDEPDEHLPARIGFFFLGSSLPQNSLPKKFSTSPLLPTFYLPPPTYRLPTPPPLTPSPELQKP